MFTCELARRLAGTGVTATPVHLAFSPGVDGVTGGYFVNRKPTTSSKASYDTAAAARLWQASADLAGLTATA
jgi:hypothetical protein